MDAEKPTRPMTVAEAIVGQTHNSERDEAAMAEVGKRQQLKRYFGFWTLLGLTASMMCTWESIFFANTAAMINGGSPTLIYGYIYGVLGALATAASLAEIASIYPTSGAQYHWTAMLATDSQKVFLSWLCGWMSTLGWLANTATGAFFAGTMIQGIMIQNDPTYDPKRWHGTLLMWAVLLLVFIVNSVGTRLLALTEGFVMFLHIATYLGILVPLVYFSPTGTAHDVFVTFNDLGGWGSNGLAWFVGLASAILPLVGYDGPAHLAEEVRDASTTVPKAMIWTVILNSLLGWGIIVAFSFCIIPMLEDALSSPTGYDFIAVFYNAVGSSGAAGMTAVLIIMMWTATFGFLATSSRQIWAFARDNGLPFSTFFAKVNQTLAIPLRSIVLCTVIPALLALINIGSTAAFSAFISLTEASLFISYLIPIMLIMIKKLKGEPIHYGPWSMGKVGVVVNLFSAVFLVIATFFGFFPPETPVTSTTMNWSCAVTGGFAIIGLFWFYVYGRRHYHGPIVERPILISDADEKI